MAYQPKSYKKFVATAATATLVATAVVPAAFADEATTAAFTDVPKSYEAAIDFVVTNAFSKGLTETQYGISAQIKRGDAAIIIANAAGLNNIDAPSAGFGDVPTRGALAVNSLKAAGVVNGKTATYFGFSDSITRGEAAIMLQRAFDLKAGNTDVPFSDVSDRYEDAVAALLNAEVTQGISATQFGTQNPIKRGDFAKFIYALRDLIELPTPAPTPGVEVLNATEVEITFDKEVLEASAETVANYTFKAALPSEQGEIAIEDIQLQEDGKSVIVRFAPGTLIDNTTYDVTVDDVITSDYQLISDWEKSFLFKADTVAPALTGANVSGSDLLLTFTEEVDFTENTVLRVDGSEVSLAGATPTWNAAGYYTYSVAAPASAISKGTHNLTLVGLEDAAGNEAGTLKTSYTVTADTTAPTVQGIQAVNADTFKVTFSEAVTAPSLTVLKGTTEYGTVVEQIASNQYLVTVDPATGEDEEGELLNPLYTANQTSVNLSVKVSDYRDAVELLGNSYTGSVTLSRDTTAPSLLSTALNTVKAVNGTTVISIPFTEDIVVADADKITVTSPDGVEVEATPAVVYNSPTSSTSTLQLTVNSAIKAGSYKVAFEAGAVRDEELNYNSAVNTTAVAAAPTVYETFNGSVESTEDNIITVDYGVEVTDSALNVANYSLDNASLPAGTTAAFVGDKTTVELRLPSTFTVVDDAPYKFEISQSVKTKNGATIVANAGATSKTNYTTNVTLLDNVAPTLQSARYALDAQGDSTTDNILLTFSEDVSFDTALDESDENDEFSVVVNGTTIAVTDADIVNGNQILLTTVSGINPIQAATVSIVPEGTANPNVSLTDASVLENAAKVGSVTVSGTVVSPAVSAQ